tara:strand:- start:338 stop:1237 length:900 start_codon:yes stop_codon:yes gene_type:complete
MKLNGIYTALITPYHNDYSINEKAYAEVINTIIEEGVHGVVVAGSTGENYTQTLEERIHLLKLSSEIIDKRVTFIAGTGGVIRTEDSIRIAQSAKSMNADAIMISSPPYAVPTNKENAIYATSIEQSVNLPVLLYNYPGRTSVHMDKEYLDIVSKSENFCGIKESSGEIDRIDFLIKKYPNIALCCGMDDQAYEYFQAGVKSWVCAGSNFSANAHIALWKTCVVEKNFNKGKKIWDAMLPLMKNLEQGGKFVQSIKHGVTIKGISAGIPRLPLQQLEKKEKKVLENIINKMNNTIKEIE